MPHMGSHTIGASLAERSPADRTIAHATCGSSPPLVLHSCESLRRSSAIEGSEHIYVGELNSRFAELDRERAYSVMCASGMRASVAAGWLQSKGFGKLDIYLGSMGAWQHAS